MASIVALQHVRAFDGSVEAQILYLVHLLSNTLAPMFCAPFCILPVLQTPDTREAIPETSLQQRYKASMVFSLAWCLSLYKTIQKVPLF